MKKLLLTFFVCGLDVVRAKEISQWISQLGGVKEYDALLLTTPTARAHDVGLTAKAVQSSLIEAFRTVHVRELSDERLPIRRPDGTRDWLPNNSAFVATVDSVSLTLPNPQTPDYDSFYFFESDCTPVTPTWLSELDAAYREAKSLCMGCIREMSDTTGRSLGLVMNGSAIYPVNIRFHSPAVRSSLRQDHEYATPWDVFAREELVPMSKHTPLIQTDFQPGPWSLDRVSPGAVVVHGCKDLSLLRALREKGLKPVSTIPQVLPLEGRAQSFSIPAEFDRLAEGAVTGKTEEWTEEKIVRLCYSLGFERLLKPTLKLVKDIKYERMDAGK